MDTDEAIMPHQRALYTAHIYVLYTNTETTVTKMRNRKQLKVGCNIGTIT